MLCVFGHIQRVGRKDAWTTCTKIKKFLSWLSDFQILIEQLSWSRWLPDSFQSPMLAGRSCPCQGLLVCLWCGLLFPVRTSRETCKTQANIPKPFFPFRRPSVNQNSLTGGIPICHLFSAFACMQNSHVCRSTTLSRACSRMHLPLSPGDKRLLLL